MHLIDFLQQSLKCRLYEYEMMMLITELISWNLFKFQNLAYSVLYKFLSVIDFFSKSSINAFKQLIIFLQHLSE